MTLVSKFLAAGATVPPTPINDIFKVDIYTGIGSTQTITNGIDFTTNGGMLWIKSRTSGTNNDNYVFDTNNKTTCLSQGNLSYTTNQVSLGTTGYSLVTYTTFNNSGVNYVSYSFEKSPNFFSVFSFNSSATNETNQRINHGLGSTPGMIMIKQTDGSGGFDVWHNSLSSATSRLMWLDTNLAEVTSANYWGSSGPTTTDFGYNAQFTTPNSPFIGYAFANTGNIKCGGFLTDGSGNASISTGWSNGAQFVLIKALDVVGSWEFYDTTRTSAWSGNDARLRADTADVEASVARLSASGSTLSLAGLSAGANYIYMIIAAP